MHMPSLLLSLFKTRRVPPFFSSVAPSPPDLLLPTYPSMAGAAIQLAPKGHFAVYTREGRRFVVPVAYLKTGVFMELFRLSEEEFGMPAGDRPITLPCDAAFMQQVVAQLSDAPSSTTLKRLRKLMSWRSVHKVFYSNWLLTLVFPPFLWKMAYDQLAASSTLHN